MFSINTFSQQDPHYTQYMHNTMSFNPAYTGSQKFASLTFLARTQWVGVEGAPDTQVLSYDTGLNWRNLGLGFNLLNDQIGPTRELYLDGNLSYKIRVSEKGNLALGMKFGIRNINVDWGKVDQMDQGDENAINVNKYLPTLGAGLYYYTDHFYLGASVPNFLKQNHYEKSDVAIERLHLFGIIGFVFDLSEQVKLKPTGLVKVVEGAPISVDVSANVLFYNRFYVGLAWRWDDAYSAMAGCYVTNRFLIGYGYDLTSSNYEITNSGTHEILLQYRFIKAKNVASPRFF